MINDLIKSYYFRYCHYRPLVLLLLLLLYYYCYCLYSTAITTITTATTDDDVDDAGFSRPKADERRGAGGLFRATEGRLEKEKFSDSAERGGVVRRCRCRSGDIKTDFSASCFLL